MPPLRNYMILIHHAASLVISFFFLHWTMTSDARRTFFDDFCQLTNLNESLICICYGSLLLYDIMLMLKEEKSSSSYRYPDAIYVLFQSVFSLSGLIAISYWGMRLYDYNLLVPKGESAPPFIMSVFTHGINFVLLLLESLLLPQKSHKSALFKLFLYSGIILGYIAIQVTFFRMTGKHVYPFLAVFTLEMTVNFYAGLFVVCYLLDRSNHLIIKVRWERSVTYSQDKCCQQVVFEETVEETVKKIH